MDFIYWSPHLYTYNASTLTKIGEKAGLKVEFVKGVQRYPLSNTLYWLAKSKPGGHKKWNFFDNLILQDKFDDILASMGATDTILAQFSKN